MQPWASYETFLSLSFTGKKISCCRSEIISCLRYLEYLSLWGQTPVPFRMKEAQYSYRFWMVWCAGWQITWSRERSCTRLPVRLHEEQWHNTGRVFIPATDKLGRQIWQISLSKGEFILFSPFVASILATTVSHSQMCRVWRGVASDEGWLISPGQVIPSTWLFKVYFTVNVFTNTNINTG